MHFRNPLRLAVVAALLCFSAATHATTYYWDLSGASSGNLTYGSGVISSGNDNWWATGASADVGWPGGNATMQIGSGSPVVGATVSRSYTGGGSAGSFTLTLSGSISLNEIVISSNLSQSGATVTFYDNGNSSNLLGFNSGNEIQNNSVENLIIDCGFSTGGSLNDESSGTVILEGASTNTSGVNIEGNGSSTSGGVLQVGNGGSTGSFGTGAFTFETAAAQTQPSTLDFDLNTPTSIGNSMHVTGATGAIIQQSGANTITMTNAVTLASTTGTLNYDIGSTGQAIDLKVTGAIGSSDSTPLVKSGAGVLQLTAANSYTGVTTVTAGTLIVSGSLSATAALTSTSGGILEVDGSANEADVVTVNGAQLQGNGLIGGATLTSGVLNAGYNSTLSTSGTLTSSGGVTLDSNSTFAVRLGLASSGSDSDTLALTSGNATLGGATLKLGLDPTNLINARIGTVYDILTDTTSTTDISGTFASLGNDTEFQAGGYTFLINYNEDAAGNGIGDDVTLTLEAVPEPGTWAMLLTGAGLLIGIHRRRLRKPML